MGTILHSVHFYQAVLKKSRLGFPIKMEAGTDQLSGCLTNCAELLTHLRLRHKSAMMGETDIKFYTNQDIPAAVHRALY